MIDGSPDLFGKYCATFNSSPDRETVHLVPASVFQRTLVAIAGRIPELDAIVPHFSGAELAQFQGVGSLQKMILEQRENPGLRQRAVNMLVQAAKYRPVASQEMGTQSTSEIGVTGPVNVVNFAARRAVWELMAPELANRLEGWEVLAGVLPQVNPEEEHIEAEQLPEEIPLADSHNFILQGIAADNPELQRRTAQFLLSLQETPAQLLSKLIPRVAWIGQQPSQELQGIIAMLSHEESAIVQVDAISRSVQPNIDFLLRTAKVPQLQDVAFELVRPLLELSATLLHIGIQQLRVARETDLKNQQVEFNSYLLKSINASFGFTEN